MTFEPNSAEPQNSDRTEFPGPESAAEDSNPLAESSLKERTAGEIRIGISDYHDHFREAVRAMEQAQLDGPFRQAHLERAHAFAGGALDILKRLEEHEPGCLCGNYAENWIGTHMLAAQAGRELKKLGSAEAHICEAVKTAEQLSRFPRLGLLKLYSPLAQIEMELGEYDEAAKVCAKVIEMWNYGAGCLDQFSAAGFTVLMAEAHLGAQRNKEAFQLLGRAGEMISASVSNTNFESAALLLERMGMICGNLHLPDEAVLFFKHGLDIVDMWGKKEHLLRARLLCDLGTAQLNGGKFDLAHQNLLEALNIAKADGNIAPATLSQIRSNLAVAMDEKGYPDRAERVIRELLMQGVRRFGPDDPQVISLYISTAECCYANAEIVEAQEFVNRAISAIRTHAGTHLARALDYSAEDFAEFIPWAIAETRGTDRKKLLDNLVSLRRCYDLLGACSLSLGKFEESQRYFQCYAALAEAMPAHGRHAGGPGLAHRRLETLFRAHAELAVKHCREISPENGHPAYAFSLLARAGIRLEQGLHDEAKEDIDAAEMVFKRLPRFRNSSCFHVLLCMQGRYFHQIEELQAAENSFLAARKLLERKGRTEHPEMLTVLQNLYSIYSLYGGEKADECEKQIIAIRDRLHRINDWRLNDGGGEF